jgi:speckle-type POZ protein
MLNFMYLFDYNASSGDQARASPMIFNAKVYSIADKYDVMALKSQAKEKFEKAAKSCWNMEDFPPAISEVYSSTPATDRGLRGLVVEISCTHIDALLARQDFRNVLEETVGFAADVTQFMAADVTQLLASNFKEYKCPNCGNHWKAVLSGGSTYYCVRCGGSRANWEQYVVTKS